MYLSKEINYWGLIVFDLDGTVLRSDKTVSRRFQEAVAKAVDKGVKFAFASGRALESVVDFVNKIPELPVDTYIIACNGALIWQHQDSSIIRTEFLNHKDISIINDFAASINTPCYLSQNRALYTPYNGGGDYNACKYSTLPIKFSGIVWNDCAFSTPKMMFIAEYEEIESIQAKIPFPLKARYHFVRSEPNYLEVMNNNVHKGSACQFLSERLNIPSSRIIAVGDEYNDVEMLQFAGLGVAMGNAHQEIKKIADWVTRTNDCDGAAYVIERWILSNDNVFESY